MSQLLLDIAPDSQPTLDNFVAGHNLELLSVLRHALGGSSSERCFYVWGEAGSGKSHLLQACVRAALDAQRSAVYARGSVPQFAEVVAMDDAEHLDEAAQIELFDLYNRLRDSGGMLLVSGTQAPLHLALRDDLRTRLGWGLVYQVHGLSDEEKTQALAQHARSRGFALPPEVTQYLLRHGRRDLPSLIAALDALDEHSLRLHRAPSVPLLKEIMGASENSDFVIPVKAGTQRA
ncbi:MAG: DnaA regulatory inactivator Hda [Gallionellales bacterium RIFCSPLOWO2_12_FULL_59_22]|nr:MAG: DnaA regulatory inactivator Hda [Gallionellales bacterium RIFCSPLOWO2_02_FULL_59_110]OGT03005.1 MAG: DnaA regulatory inactivator Hda [Gallionellales bacterium RIFCSPLOWO2_02_58_13]OGT12590.1 MAG: DnaA regulatory inactivator Hda [Gallionellales bacterium RIFCSPLOWO2_12_FULL_59_22]